MILGSLNIAKKHASQVKKKKRIKRITRKWRKLEKEKKRQSFKEIRKQIRDSFFPLIVAKIVFYTNRYIHGKERPE